MDSQNKNTFLAEIKKAKSAKDFDAMLLAAQTALRAFPGDSTFFDLLHDAQTYYVDAKLHSDVVRQLQAKQDWATLQAVYQKLLTVFPESKKLHKLLKKVRQKINEGGLLEEKNQFQGIKLKIEELVKAGKLDDALRASYEVLAKNPDHQEFKAIAEKIERRLNRQIEKDLTKYFDTSIPALKSEYRANKNAFVSV